MNRKEDEMIGRESFSAEEAQRVGEVLGIDWASAPFDVDQFRRGMDVELEHGLRDSATNVTADDPVITGKIALAHLHEFADYYTRLEQMEERAKEDQLEQRSGGSPSGTERERTMRVLSSTPSSTN